MDRSMLVCRHDDRAGLLLGIAVVVIVPLLMGLCLKFRGKWTTATVPAVGEDSAIVLRSHGVSPPRIYYFAPWVTTRLLRLPSTVCQFFENLADSGGALRWNDREAKGRELKVSFEPLAVTVAGVQGEGSMDVFLKLDCTMSEGRTIVKLAIEQMDVDVKTICTRNCSDKNQSCGEYCDQIFPHQLEIKLRPNSWAQGCHRLRLEPHTTANVFLEQQMSNRSFQVPIANPHQASVSYQSGNAVSRSAALFEWLPASRDDSSKAVTWRWAWRWVLSRYEDGTKLKFNKANWGSRPRLGVQLPHMQMHPGLHASWEVLPNTELDQPHLAWDMTVIVHTAFRKRGGARVSRGPTLPFKRQIHSHELPN
ncbi:unnamed protein product [Calypogeia fissa]